MNKLELEAAVMETTGRDKKAVGEIVNAVFDNIAKQLASGGEVNIAGFGKFSVKVRAARPGRNPSTGQAITIEASKSIGFKAGKKLKDQVAG